MVEKAHCDTELGQVGIGEPSDWGNKGSMSSEVGSLCPRVANSKYPVGFRSAHHDGLRFNKEGIGNACWVWVPCELVLLGLVGDRAPG